MHAHHATARENERRTLLTIAHFGHITTAQIGAAVWTDSNAATQAAAASRLLKRLEARGDVLKRQDNIGHARWVLTRQGANKGPSWAHHGYDLSLRNATRSDPVTELLIEKNRKGFGIIGPVAIRSGIAPRLQGLPLAGAWVENGQICGVMQQSSKEQLDAVKKLLKVEVVSPAE